MSKTAHQNCDFFKEVGSPSALAPYYLFEAVWPAESLERYTKISRQFADRRGVYDLLNQTTRQEFDQRTLRRLQNLVKYAYVKINKTMLLELWQRRNLPPSPLPAGREASFIYELKRLQ